MLAKNTMHGVGYGMAEVNCSDTIGTVRTNRERSSERAIKRESKYEGTRISRKRRNIKQ